MVLPDPTMFLPLGVGFVSLLNVELSSKNRLNQTEDATGTLEGRNLPGTTTREGTTSGGGGGMRGMSASEKRRIVARKARDGENVKVRGYATTTTTTPTVGGGSSGPPEVAVGGTKPNTARIVTNILRFASVAFIPVAGLAPSVRFQPFLYTLDS